MLQLQPNVNNENTSDETLYLLQCDVMSRTLERDRGNYMHWAQLHCIGICTHSQ